MRFMGAVCLAIAMLTAGCGGDDDAPVVPSGDHATDPDTAPRAAVDRFSADAGMLMVRSDENDLPGPNEPIDFDSGEPFVTQGLGPDGEVVKYYNFDVQPTAPAPIYALFRAGESSPVSGQLNIVDVVPGDKGYNDFWQVMKVTVPADYVTNSVTSASALRAAGYPIDETDMLVNCPIVPDGSTATMRLGDEDPGLSRGWYRDGVVFYFNFSEAMLTTTGGNVPVSPIFVTFNVNPDPNDPMSGPASGFEVEPNSAQTHNVPATLPDDAGYSPLWGVQIYDNADFETVMDLASVEHASILVDDGPTVNCPIVSIE